MHESSSRPYLWLFIVLAVAGLAADQASKYVVFAKLYPGDLEMEASTTVIPGLFDLRTMYTYQPAGEHPLAYLRTLSGERMPRLNKGALFGIGNTGDGLNWLFALISFLAAGFIGFWISRPVVANDRLLCFALGLILAGTLGNLYDRIVFGGVRDFLHCYYDTHIWPDFNIADCCLVCGAGVLLVHSFFVTDQATEPAKPAAAETSAPLPTTSSSTGA